MTTKPKGERLVTFHRNENGEVEVVVRGDVPQSLVARIYEHRHALLEWLQKHGGVFPPVAH